MHIFCQVITGQTPNTNAYPSLANTDHPSSSVKNLNRTTPHGKGSCNKHRVVCGLVCFATKLVPWLGRTSLDLRGNFKIPCVWLVVCRQPGFSFPTRPYNISTASTRICTSSLNRLFHTVNGSFTSLLLHPTTVLFYLVLCNFLD